MKALILAAGLGSRLAPLTNNIPKSLVEVNGTPILIKQIENLMKNNIVDITVVTGYLDNCINEKLEQLYPDVTIVHNPDFKNTNNMYSALLGKNAVSESNFLMMNADVFYDDSVLKALVEFPSENAIVTDIGRYLDEAMKIKVKDGRIIEISKQISEDEYYGSTSDIYKFSKEAGKLFFEKCEEYIYKKRELQKWSEVALNDILSCISFVPCPLVGRWLEIDNHDDLFEANQLFKN